MTFMSFIGPLLLAGLLHMEESYCMLYMPVYLVTIPSMYILLVIYSLFNLWNTGENICQTPVQVHYMLKVREFHCIFKTVKKSLIVLARQNKL